MTDTENIRVTALIASFVASFFAVCVTKPVRGWFQQFKSGTGDQWN
jgi:hypothetical protein